MPAAEGPGQIGALLGAAVGGGGIPGAVAVAGQGPVTLGRWAAGQADALQGRPMHPDTIFDLASLTKVVATTTVTLALAGRGQLGLGDPVADYLPGFGACRDARVTIAHLLTHTSGLPGSRPFYRWCGSRADLLRDLRATPLEAPPGSRVRYSDPGFITLGEVVAAAAGEPLDAAVGRLVTGPLGLTSTNFVPNELAHRFAATEPRGDGSAWVGVVHDENARLLGGVAGHAGLFAPAQDLARFAAWWVSDDDTAVPAGLRRAAAACQAQSSGGRRGYGWACAGDGFDILGGRWGTAAVSHTGFTGTSLALDPATGRWLVLLTNAVHFGRDAAAVQALRRAVHAAFGAAGGAGVTSRTA
jgi:CubicO group peptidase (beta-lactamase class C family)